MAKASTWDTFRTEIESDEDETVYEDDEDWGSDR